MAYRAGLPFLQTGQVRNMLSAIYFFLQTLALTSSFQVHAFPKYKLGFLAYPYSEVTNLFRKYVRALFQVFWNLILLHRARGFSS